MEAEPQRERKLSACGVSPVGRAAGGRVCRAIRDGIGEDRMTRVELLRLLVGQARSNGFEFRRWYTGRLGMPWEGVPGAVDVLAEQRRYYALLFSHEFACSFWKAGSEMTVHLPAGSFERILPDGTVRTVARKSFLRRMTREDAWRFHLREMAVQEEPLRYMRKFLRVQEELEVEKEPERPIVIVDEEDLLPEED